MKVEIDIFFNFIQKSYALKKKKKNHFEHESIASRLKDAANLIKASIMLFKSQ